MAWLASKSDTLTRQLALANSEAACDIALEPLQFYQNVSTNKALRDASVKCEERVRKYANQESMRDDLYKAKVTADANLRKSGAWDKLSDEQKRLVDKMLLDGKRAGLALEKKEDKERLKELKDELSEVCLKFTVCAPFRAGGRSGLDRT